MSISGWSDSDSNLLITYTKLQGFDCFSDVTLIASKSKAQHMLPCIVCSRRNICANRYEQFHFKRWTVKEAGGFEMFKLLKLWVSALISIH